MSPQQKNIDLAVLDAKTKELIEAFEAHPRMAGPNPHSTIFFLCDFVKNSHKMLKSVDAEKYAAGNKQARDTIQEVVGRNQFAILLANDTTGQLAAMTAQDPSDRVDLGPTIKAKAKELAEL
ncbi:hypothetical protein POX_g08807 [Penicillium oxalicum]|uniref:hypothetical protein n=1 Tax=Penicillium oxalicum TaxID=69781 RepID=UPI0020B65F0E|nr:hypothetical protein POX_g08807 [Penicillium oxalicum]KAI2786422.1 hypothetical protein POX_g08807 [Penicillium oxalicum]